MSIHKQRNWILCLFAGVLVIGSLLFNTAHVNAKEVNNTPQLKAATNTISGKVLTGDEQPIPVVKVELYDASTNTLKDTKMSGSDGTYTFSSLEDGDYYCKVYPPSDYEVWWSPYYGPDAQTGNITVNATHQVDDVNVYLRYIPKTGGIAGTVVDDNNNQSPVAHAKIYLYDISAPHHQVASTESAADGTYSFPGLQNDWYYIEFVTPQGYTFHFQENKTHFGEDQTSDFIYVDGKTVINEKEPEGPSYGTTIHLLSDNPPTPTFEEQYVVQANDTHNNGVPSGSPHPIYGMGYPVTNNGTIALKMLSVVTHFKNYGDFSIFKKDTHEYVDWSAVSSRFEFVSSNTSVIDFHEAAGAAAEGNEFWIQGNVGDSTQISIKDRSTGKVVYTFTVNIVN